MAALKWCPDVGSSIKVAVSTLPSCHSLLLDAVTSRKADNQEDHKDQNQDHKYDEDLHLHILPPHFAAQLSPCFVKLVRLHTFPPL